MLLLSNEKYILSENCCYLQMNRIGKRKEYSKLAYTPHRHMFYELELIISGEGTAYIGTDSFSIANGSTIFVRPDDVHWYDSRDNVTIDVISLKFTEQYIPEYIRAHPDDFRNSRIGMLADDDFTALRELLRSLCKLQSGNGDLCEKYSDAIKSAVIYACSLFARSNMVSCKSDSHTEPHGIITQVIYHINTGIDQDLRLVHVAELFGYSPNYLGKIFADETGTHYSEYVSRVRAEVAYNRIERTSLPIKQIAKDCGFGSCMQLLRALKKYYAVTPGQLREISQKLNSKK